MERVRDHRPAHSMRRRVPAPRGVAVHRGSGPHMLKSASAFFDAWLAALDAGLVNEGEIRFQARGTSYARAGRGSRTLAPLVSGSRLEPWVDEDPGPSQLQRHARSPRPERRPRGLRLGGTGLHGVEDLSLPTFRKARAGHLPRGSPVVR